MNQSADVNLIYTLARALFTIAANTRNPEELNYEQMLFILRCVHQTAEEATIIIQQTKPAPLQPPQDTVE